MDKVSFPKQDKAKAEFCKESLPKYLLFILFKDEGKNYGQRSTIRCP